MAKVFLNLDSLGELDGGAAGAVINAAINSAVADLDDRGEDRQARKVTIEIAMKKLANQQIDTQVSVKTAIPAYKTNSTFAQVGRKADRPAVYFQEMNPDNPDQGTFDALDKQRKDGDS